MRSRRKYSISQEDRGCVGADISPDALTLARGKGFARLDLLSAGKPLPYADQSFDIITALEVLEHISDDAGAVSERYRVLRPGGLLLVSVPAFSWLWSEHTKHCRISGGIRGVSFTPSFRDD